jgi:HK97 family phage major capsid protein
MSFRELRLVIDDIEALKAESQPLIEKLKRGERLSAAESRKIAENGDKALDLRKREIDLRAAAALSEEAQARIWNSASSDAVTAEERSFTEYLRHGTVSPEMRAAGEASGSAGGYLVPPGWWQRLQVALKAYGGVAADFQQLPTDTGQPMQWATVNPTTTVGSLISENTQVSDVDYTFGQGTIAAYMYTSGVQLVSFQLAQDSAFDIDSFIQARVAESLGRAEAQAVISGTGSGQPLGIITALAATSGQTSGGVYQLGTGTKVNVSGAAGTTGANQVTELVAGTLAPSDWLGVLASVDKAYRALGAKWYMNDATLQNTRMITNGFGDPFYAELQDDTAPKLYGYPVVVDNNLPNLTASTASGVIFGHLESAMVLRKVKGAGLLRLDQRFADFLQQGYIGYERIDSRSNDLRAATVVKAAAS